MKIADKDAMLNAGGQVMFTSRPEAFRKISKTICRTSSINFVGRPAMRTPYARRTGQVGKLGKNMKMRLIWKHTDGNSGMPLPDSDFGPAVLDWLNCGAEGLVRKENHG